MGIEAGNDGLVMPEVGRWSKQKHFLLQRYLTLFATGMKNKWPERHFVDLFAGAGLARVKDSGEVVAGSSLIAAQLPDPFTFIHACESDPTLAAALRHRLGRMPGVKFRVIDGNANTEIDQLLKPIPSEGALTVVFADPFGLHFDFKTVEAIKRRLRRADLIVLLADNMDAIRNWMPYYLHDPNSSLDRFLGDPRWREEFQTSAPSKIAGQLRSLYERQLKSVGYTHFGYRRVQNDQDRDIYTLVFATSHERGLDFWKKAGEVDADGQRQLPFA